VALIKSISGIRGTIGGKPGTSLSPLDVVKFTAAFGTIISESSGKNALPKVVIGRDGRISGSMINHLVTNTLISLGIEVIDLGLSTTPTVEIATKAEGANGGIIITASHNPKEWNALKLLNSEGEFIDAETGERLLQLASESNIQFAPVDKLGKVSINNEYLEKHIQLVLDYPLVNAEAIQNRNFKSCS
jgi:phosphomannomutase